MATDFVLGWIFSLSDDSSGKSWFAVIPSEGIIIITNIIIPRPPIQWVRLLQKRTE